MARSDKNVVDYFPHQCNTGKTLFILENKYPYKGYCTWFKTLELLGKNNNHFIDCRKKEDWQYLSAYMRLPEEELQQIYDTLADLDAIHSELWKNKIIWSLNFIKGIKDVYRKRGRMCIDFITLCDDLKINLTQKYTKNGILVAENDISGTENSVFGTESTQSKVEYSKVEDSIVD
jgi:hypothetical protein